MKEFMMDLPNVIKMKGKRELAPGANCQLQGELDKWSDVSLLNPLVRSLEIFTTRIGKRI